MMDKYWYFVLSYIHKLFTMKSNLWKSKGLYKTLYVSVTNLIFELIFNPLNQSTRFETDWIHYFTQVLATPLFENDDFM